MAPSWQIILGTAETELPKIQNCSCDSMVTDPPGAIGILGEEWDGDLGGRDKWVAWMTGIMAEAFRILKPGAYALAWSIPKTSHWTAWAMESAGFLVCDRIVHLFGQAKPQGKDLGNGRHTRLKPAHEDWMVGLKPPEGTFAENFAQYGCGGFSVDECRIGYGDKSLEEVWKEAGSPGIGAGRGIYELNIEPQPVKFHPSGRFPTNLILSHSEDCTDDGCTEDCPIRLLDEQAGNRKSGARKAGVRKGLGYGGGKGDGGPAIVASSGGASRFFYCSKVSQSEKNAGLPPGMINDHKTVKPISLMRYLTRLATPEAGLILDPFCGSGSTACAAALEGFSLTGVEKEARYVDIARLRLAYWAPQQTENLWAGLPEE